MDETKWWLNGATSPTNNFRWKRVEWEWFDRLRVTPVPGMVLQQLHTDPRGGTRRVWFDVPVVAEETADEQ